MSDLSRVYATALFELAQDTNRDSDIANQLVELNQAFDATIHDAMESIDLTITDKKSVMEAVLKDHVDQLVIHFIDVLLENHRFWAFSQIVDDYLKLYRQKHNITIASLVSPRPLDDDALDKIKKTLESRSGYTVELECAIDPVLIAGFTIEMDGVFMDYSLTNRLNALKNQLKKEKRHERYIETQ